MLLILLKSMKVLNSIDPYYIFFFIEIRIIHCYYSFIWWIEFSLVFLNLYCYSNLTMDFRSSQLVLIVVILLREAPYSYMFVFEKALIWGENCFSHTSQSIHHSPKKIKNVNLCIHNVKEKSHTKGFDMKPLPTKRG